MVILGRFKAVELCEQQCFRFAVGVDIIEDRDAVCKFSILRGEKLINARFQSSRLTYELKVQVYALVKDMNPFDFRF